MKNPVDRIRSYHAELKAIRHDIHAHPELAFVEQRTSALVVEYLKKWGIETHTGLAKTGVVADVQGTVRGRGGHAAIPQPTVDPVVASAHIISALQTIASRNVNPLDAVVVSICSMQTSQVGAFNVIPDSVRLIGTVRSFRPETRDLAEERVKAISLKTAEALGATAEVQYARGYPPTVN